MKSFEMNKKTKSSTEYVHADYRETPYHHLLLKLPNELLQKHLGVIETQKMNNTDALEYLNEIVAKRKEATRETFVSDEKLETSLRDATLREDVLHQLETTVSESPDIGIGSTARIKRFDVDGTPIAVKYLVSPTAKTLSASAEHDMLHEVERIRAVEKLESRAPVDHIRVPHPYFHHKDERIQCYGMELINGVTLATDIHEEVYDELRTELRTTLSKIPEETLYKEVDTFFQLMHEYCLHGDIKPANIMISNTGMLYIIDFGQSVLMHEVSEKEQEQVGNLKENEVIETKMAIRHFLRILFQDDQKEVPRAA